jgi:hypothetical protein
MGSLDRLEAWLRADEECPPVLYRPETTAMTADTDDFGPAFEKVRAELRRVGRLLLELSSKIDFLAR